MAKKMKTRKGKDNIYYPYTSPDLVIDSAGESQTTKNTNMKTDIDSIKTDLGTAQLTTTAKDVKGAVNEVAAQYKDIVNNKADKNSIFTMANMGQDVKEAMTGGSVAVVGNNCIDIGQFVPTIQSDIGEWVNQEFVLEDKGYNTSTGAVDPNADSRIKSFELTAASGTKIKIHGFTFGGEQCSIMFLDSNDTLISKIADESWGTPASYEFTCPNKTSKVRMNTWSSNGDKSIEKFVYSPIATKKDIKIALGGVPDFYRQHIDEKIKQIQKLEMLHGGNGCTFAIITDIHIGNNDKYSPALIKEIMENTNCKFVINNGDTAFYTINIENTKENGIADLSLGRKLFNNATNNKFYCVRGNHDNNSTGAENENPDYLLSESEMYSLLIEKYDDKIVGDINNPTGLYYYFDDNKNKIRHIILDSFEEGQGEGVMSVKQMKWFCETALNFSDNNWNICLYTHKPISPFETSQFSEVREILMAVRYGKQYQKTYNDNTANTYEINVNFAGKGHIIMFVANGHYHIDALKQDNDITYFKSVCDAKYADAEEITDRTGINTQSFDIVCVNKNNRQINLVRIGCGNDRIFTYGEGSSVIQNKDMTKK